MDHFFVQARKPELVIVLEYEEWTESRRREAAATPATKEALRAIEGVGKGRTDKYAEDVFKVLASFAA